jgi:hypothetical protein
MYDEGRDTLIHDTVLVDTDNDPGLVGSRRLSGACWSGW